MSFPTFTLFVILHEGHPCPKLQNPMLGIAEKNLLPWGEGPRVRSDEGVVESALPRPSPTFCDDPPLSEGEG